MSYGKSILLSLFFGSVVGITGTYILFNFITQMVMEIFLSNYFSWLNEHLYGKTAFILVAVLEQLASFGILAFIAGFFIGRITGSKWVVSSLFCYLGVWIYPFVQAVFRGEPLPFSAINIFEPLHVITLLVMPACIGISAFYSVNRYNKSSNSDGVNATGS